LIRDIVFDIGRVIVGIRAEPMLEFLVSRGAPRLTLTATLERVGLSEHETGYMDGAGLIERFRVLAPQASSDELRKNWLEIFYLHEDMVQLARRVSTQHRVYLLSNIGDLHWEHLVDEHGMAALGHGVLTSFHARVMKPDAAIYAQAENKFALVPASTVFIDDRTENVDAARLRGWHGIVHRNFHDTRQALVRLGVEAAR
jgi:FMN phosphatase YigB (HAD superfamily)